MIKVGVVYGWWSVVHGEPKKEKGKTYFWCRCFCGVERWVCSYYMRTGKSTCCGCARALSSPLRTHGKSRTREHRIWKAMKTRCNNPRIPHYNHYGGRGISICQRWENDFSAFLEDMGDCPPGYSLERIDVNGDYTPENCKWASAYEQARNRRARKKKGINGVRKIKSKWVVYIGADYRNEYAGTFEDFFEACCARKSAELKYWGES